MKIAVLQVLLLAASSAGAQTLVFEGKSEYNAYISVTESDGMRTLSFERDGARQSVVKVGDPGHLELPYTYTSMASLVLCRDVKRVLVIGLGGGSVPMFLRKHYPKAVIDAVDIDPVVVKVARQYMGFREDPALHAHVADGRRFIEKTRQPYDIIFLDAFGTDSIPMHLATVEFMQAVRRALTPEGVVAGNVWGLGSNPLFDSMVRTYQEVFETVYDIRAQGAGNHIILGVPRVSRLDRTGFVQRTHALTKQQQFSFDLGTIVEHGYRKLTRKDLKAEVLRDKPKK